MQIASFSTQGLPVAAVISLFLTNVDPATAVRLTAVSIFVSEWHRALVDPLLSPPHSILHRMEVNVDPLQPLRLTVAPNSEPAPRSKKPGQAGLQPGATA